MMLFASDGSCIKVNAAWERLWRADASDVDNYNIFHDPQLKNRFIIHQLEKVFSGKPARNDSLHYIPKESGLMGRERWIEIFAYPRKDMQGKVKEVVLIQNDVTARKETEIKLRASEDRFRTMAEFLPQKIFMTTPEGKLYYCNPQWAQYTGAGTEELIDSGLEHLIHPNELEEFNSRWQRSLSTGEKFEMEQRLLRFDGVFRRHLTRARPLKNDGDITAWLGTSTDIEASRRTVQRKRELEVITAGLKEQREQLLQLSEVKDDFISLASHQLRTPATGVKQYIGMVLDGIAGEINDSQRAFLQQAYQSNERQLTIVDDLLQVAQVDSGKLRLNKESIDIIALVKDVVNEQQSKFRQQQQTVTFTASRKKIIARVDHARLRMVIENLLNNAVKFSAKGDTIQIKITRPDNTACIAVTDNGPGIPQKDQQKVFEKFGTLGQAASNANGGTGLGLYWGKKLVELHGGKITIESQSGKGSTFTIHVPL